MRTPWGSVLLGAAICACGGDEGTNPSLFDAAPPVDARVVDAPAAMVVDARLFDARVFDAMVGAAPVIRAVVITHAQPCARGVASAVTVEIVATDAESAAGNLTYSGTSGSCGAITGRVSNLTCPQVAPYGYTVTVSDPDGNMASASFIIGVCSNTPDAGPI